MTCRATTGCCSFEKAHQAWAAGDFAGFLAGLDNDIEWIVNMDGISIPYVLSSVGKEDLRWRLEHLMNTFRIERFNVESFVHGPDVCRSVVSICYVHRGTGEPLDVKLRFTGWQRDGVLVRCEETSDAAYVAAYDRFVRFLEAARNGNGGQV